ncbi:FAD-binding oxidoreductase [Marinicauda algicola]|uniref:FAD-binding oxidoreductase n=1 Tax=Marinicauda algicola TaxID=2029849 RepID=A0A4S2H397_9PROT|nr:FAD-binding oxidoreductase [Marinicauda algicola]TGY90036.1 FAD-binding oxidoreductase [Marinicauda algicola]
MKRPRGKGVTMRRRDKGFDSAVLSTSFSGRDPGRRPDVYIQANNACDVVAAVKLAREQGHKISLCSGGHSWAQNHLRDGGLLLDLSRLDTIEIDADARTARVGPGCWSVDLDRALKKRGLFFPVAHAPDVCLGGFLLQGGFGWNSRALGLACESVLGLDVVLADGSTVHANAEQNPDLYWAARGAGPGFFGAVTSFHLKLHERPKVTAMIIQVFHERWLEDVFSWAHEIGPGVSDSVEFQLLITPRTLFTGRPGIEVIAPVMASCWKDARRATSFIHESPVRKRASVTTPLVPLSTMAMSETAARTHFPPKMHWCVDNMWTDAAAVDLLPGIRKVADTLPPAPSHALWLNWQPSRARPDMAFSMEANFYFAAYGEWRRAEDDARYGSWATERISEMAHLAKGIQLADENLGRRTARFMSDAHRARLEQIRAAYDPEGRFHSYMTAP